MFARIAAAASLATAIIAGYSTSTSAQSSNSATPTVRDRPEGAAGESSLDAGVGIVDITPTESVVLAGSPTRLKSSVVSTRLYVKALVLSSTARKVVIVTLDTLKYPVERVVEARRQIERSTGIPTDNVIICASHTHRGPLWTYYEHKLVTPIAEAVMKRREQPSYRYFFTGIRIGDDFAIVTNPDELFCEIGISIKQNSPFKHTMVAEQTNGAHGYVPTAKAFAGGSYETWFGEHSYLTTRAGEIIEKESLDILSRLKRGDS
ncbi:MAG TPA: hypothetical protein VF278_08100 [Pirellulales bacterium]